MAASFTIHFLAGPEQQEAYKLINGNTIGSQYCTLMDGRRSEEDSIARDRAQSLAHKVMATTPAVTIGDVSWLKAAFLEDGERFIPSPIERMSELIGEEFPILDANLRDNLLSCLSLKNSSSYPDLISKEELQKALDANMGTTLCHISW